MRKVDATAARRVAGMGNPRCKAAGSDAQHIGTTVIGCGCTASLFA